MGSTDYSSDGKYGKPRENNFLAKLAKPVVFIPLILLILCLAIFLYKDAQVNELRAQLEQEREQANQEKALVVRKANQRISESSKYFLKLMSMPFSWAVRTALLSGNVAQVDQYLYQFVQEKNFDLVLVADAKGKIISSTNQKYTGSQLSDHFNQSYLTTDSTVINEANSGKLTIVSPIMGFNSKLGTMLATYTPDQPMQNTQAVAAKSR